MGWRDIVGDYQRWQERWRDPILTALLVLLSLDVFVIMPRATEDSPARPIHRHSPRSTHPSSRKPNTSICTLRSQYSPTSKRPLTCSFE
jgi:hypothetical protein